MINTDLLKTICEIPGAPGFEQVIRSFVIENLEGLVDEINVDALGNVIAIKRGRNDKKVMVAAHMDEISFIVTHIDDEGFVRFQPLGGFDPKTLTAQRVFIHAQDKNIVGVMGTKPIHVLKPEERKKAPELSDFFIDTGMTVENVKKYVSIGDPITRERELIVMGDCVNSKSLDNRVSVFILIETLKELKDEKELPFDIYAAFTVQEEVGMRGAMTAASGADPEYAIALDVTLAYDLPGATPQEMVSRLGEGAAIKILDGQTICDYRMVRFLKKCAEEKNIKHQMEILPAGGTDTAGLQRFSKGGSIAGAISIPTRYLHQVIEMSNISDIRACIELLKTALLEIDNFDWNHN